MEGPRRLANEWVTNIIICSNNRLYVIEEFKQGIAEMTQWIKNTYCCKQRFQVVFLEATTPGCSQSPLTPVLGDLTPSSGLLGCLLHVLTQRLTGFPIETELIEYLCVCVHVSLSPSYTRIPKKWALMPVKAKSKLVPHPII